MEINRNAWKQRYNFTNFSATLNLRGRNIEMAIKNIKMG